MTARTNIHTTAHAAASALIVDNHADSGIFLRDLLQFLYPALRVEVAETAAEAIALHTALQPQVALIDINLPDANGLDLLRTLLGQRPLLAAIMVSVHDHALYRTRALASGARAYVAKHDIISTMLPVLNDALGPPTANRLQTATTGA
jgi:DNA-binding NarL/FixJ family response regulator